jgi:hypothetical protein
MRTVRVRRGGGASGEDGGGGADAGGLGGTVVAIAYLLLAAGVEDEFGLSGIAAAEGLELTVGSGTSPRRATSLSHCAGVSPALGTPAERASPPPSGV